MRFRILPNGPTLDIVEQEGGLLDVTVWYDQPKIVATVSNMTPADMIAYVRDNTPPPEGL